MSRLTWAARLGAIRRELVAMYLALRDPRTPGIAKAAVILVLVYAVSPWDLVPEWILGLGLVDDLLLVSFGMNWAMRLVPEDVRARHRADAERLAAAGRRRILLGGIILLGIWILFGVALALFVNQLLGN